MSGGSSNQVSQSTQDVWKPWADAMEPMLAQSGEMFDQGMAGITDPSLQQDQANWNQGIQDSAMSGWQNQMQGGNLAGYDVTGALANQMGQNNNVFAQQTGPAIADYSAMGDVDQSHAWDQYNANVGPGGSLANVEGMFRRQAQAAGQDMLGGLDARAAASGMSGGSRHGTAITGGLAGINSNLQDQMAQTGYDAYNRDLDRKLNIGATTDQYNQQRDMTNNANRHQYGLANQSSINQSARQNQAADLAAQQGNQNYAAQQQQLMSGLVGQQNANQQGALNSSGAMAGLGDLGYRAAMGPYAAYSQMLQGMGPATVLSESTSSGTSRQGGL